MVYPDAEGVTRDTGNRTNDWAFSSSRTLRSVDESDVRVSRSNAVVERCGMEQKVSNNPGRVQSCLVKRAPCNKTRLLLLSFDVVVVVVDDGGGGGQ